MKRNQGKKNHLGPNLSQDHSLGLGLGQKSRLRSWTSPKSSGH